MCTQVNSTMSNKNQNTIDPEVAEHLAIYLLDQPITKPVDWPTKVLETRTYEDFTYCLSQVIQEADSDSSEFSVNDIVDEVVHYNKEQFKLFMALVKFKYTYFGQ